MTSIIWRLIGLKGKNMAFNQPLTKNGEGYPSPTEFEAIRNIMRGNGLRNGEIWETENQMGVRKYVVVIAEHERFSQIVTLTADEYHDSIAIKCNGEIMYTTTNMLSYTFNEYFTHFVRVLDDDEFEDVLRECMKSLGLNYLQPEGVVEVEKVVEKVVEVPVEKIVEKVVEVPVAGADEVEIEVLRAKVQVYKDFCEQAMGMIKDLVKKG